MHKQKEVNQLMSKEYTRTYNTIANTLFGVVAAAITIILNFVVRVVLVRELGEEINGLHNLFQSVANMIALMEAEISTAMVIHLYKPIKEKNKDKIKEVMFFYRNTYVLLAITFTFVCAVVDVFFMDKLVTTTIEMSKVRVLFVVFSLSFITKYLTYHKRSILYAEQKNRVSVGVNTVCELIFRTAEIVSVIVFHEYMIFLILMICEAATSNLICSRYVEKYHPYLKSYRGVKASKATKTAIVDTIKPLFVTKIAGTVQQSARSILVSILLGNISIVGYFGNYQLVSNAMMNLFSQMGGAVTSSFGNLAVENEKARMYVTFRKAAFLMNSIAVVLCAGFISCIQPFIRFAFGDSFVLPYMSMILISVELIVYLFAMPIISVQNAMGLHRKDRNQMVAQAIIAVTMGYLLGRFYGMNGILIGLIVPYVIFTYINKGIVVSKFAFEKKATAFLKQVLVDIVKAGVVITGAVIVASIISTGSLMLDFLLKGVCSVGISLVLLVILSWENEYFRLFYDAIKRKVGRK